MGDRVLYVIGNIFCMRIGNASKGIVRKGGREGKTSHSIRPHIAGTEILIILLSVTVLASVVSFFLPLTYPFSVRVPAASQKFTYKCNTETV